MIRLIHINFTLVHIWYSYLFIFLYIYLSTINLSLGLSMKDETVKTMFPCENIPYCTLWSFILTISIYLTSFLSIYLYIRYLSFYLSNSQTLYLVTYLHIFNCLSINPSIYLFIYLGRSEEPTGPNSNAEYWSYWTYYRYGGSE